MPEKEQKSKLSCTTGKGYFYKSSSPKFKYIQDPSEFVDNNYKNDYSQYLIPYDVITVDITPVWGPYSGQRITIQYDWDTVQLSIRENKTDVMPLKPGTSPDRFVRFALDLVHRTFTDTKDRCSGNSGTFKPVSLVTHCLRSAIIHLKHLPETLTTNLPREFHGYFCKDSQISVDLNVWPSCAKLARRTTVIAQRGMVIGEFYWLIRYILKLDGQVRINLFRRFLPLNNQDTLSDNDVIDCVISSMDVCRLKSGLKSSENKKFVLTKIGPAKFEISTKEFLVVSLVGKGVQEIPVSQSETLSTLDQTIRQTFRLRQSTLLTFKNPRQQAFLLRTCKVIKSQKDEEKVKDLIAKKRRNFPACGPSVIPMKRLYKECPVYSKSLKSLGFYSGCFVEVFEVTGPTIPIMLFGDIIEPCALDVNPAWSLGLFLYYLRICCGRDENFTNIDYVRFIDDKSVSDVLDMMGSLWWKDKRTSIVLTDRLEYLKVRV